MFYNDKYIANLQLALKEDLEQVIRQCQRSITYLEKNGKGDNLPGLQNVYRIFETQERLSNAIDFSTYLNLTGKQE